MVSFLLHALLLAGLCSLGWDVQVDLSHSIMVDLLVPSSLIDATPLRPRQEEFSSKGSERAQAARRPKNPLNEYRQETISLNTKRLKYLDYTGKIKRKIYAHWRYPEQARRAHFQGHLLVEFGILGSGSLAGSRVLKSSGHLSLDQGALEAIRAAPPFPPLPQHFRLDRLNIRARFFYRLIEEG